MRRRTSSLTAFLLSVMAAAAWAQPGSGPNASRHNRQDAPQETASTAEPYYFRQQVFSIPFSVNASQGQPVEVQLFVSTDRGTNWHLYTRQNPGDGQFPFQARSDGEFWFASRTIYSGQPPQKTPPQAAELRVVVDTAQPQLQFTASAGSSGEIEAAWQIQDPFLAADTFKLEYQAGDGSWQQVNVEVPPEEIARSSLDGRTSWWPRDAGDAVQVRAEIRDRAGNLTAVARRVTLPRIAQQPAQQPARPASSFASQSRPGHELPAPHAGQAGAAAGDSHDLPYKPPVMAGTSAMAAAAAGGSSPAAEVLPPPRVVGRPGSSDSAADRGWPSDVTSATPPGYPPASYSPAPAHGARQQTVTAESQSPHAGSSRYTRPSPQSLDQDTRQPESQYGTRQQAGEQAGPVARATGTGADDRAVAGPYRGVAGPVNPAVGNRMDSRAEPVAPPQDFDAGLPAGEQARISNSRRFELDYDVDAVGPDGVADVELWITRDGGRHWNRWLKDEDRKSPIVAEVPEEGVFGFRLVIVSRNGLASPAPLPGEPADLWVEVDATRPQAQLTGAIYGEGHEAGHLKIQWQASDRHLAERPVALLFSQSADGPWTTVASGLENSGSYAWKVDRHVPRQIYLRLEVRDAAGNLAADQLVDAVDIGGLTPQGVIRGLRAVGDR